MTEHDKDHVWEARERVVVGLTGGPEDETLIRRAARVAARSARGSEIDLLAVHVLAGDGSVGTSSPARAAAAGGKPRGQLPPGHRGQHSRALLEFARAVEATQLVIGTRRRSRWARALRAGIGAEVVARSGEIDVHIVTHSAAGWARAPTAATDQVTRSPSPLVGTGPRGGGCPCAHGGVSGRHGRTLAGQRHAGLPGAGHRRRSGRWLVAGAGRRHGQRAGGELVLHSTHRPAARGPPRRPAGPGRLSRHSGRGGHRGGPVGSPGRRRGPVPRRNGDARLPVPLGARR